MFKKILYSIAVSALAFPATALAQIAVEDVEVVEESLPGLIDKAINFALGLVVLLAVGLIIYGGVKMMTSQGKSEDFKQAQNIVIYAIIGLIVAFLAWALVNWVLQELLSQGGTTSS